MLSSTTCELMVAQKCVPYIPAYKSKNFGQFFLPSESGGRLICGSENLPPAVDMVISQVSCVNSGWPVGGAWSAVVCET